jgi:hypothetical protein
LEIGTVESVVSFCGCRGSAPSWLALPANIFDVAPDGHRFLFNIPERGP